MCLRRMTAMSKLGLFLSLFFVALLTASPGVQAQGEASWTIIYYSVADTDLEEPMLQDINEMEWVGSTDDVIIVVQIDRAADYTDIDGDWTDARRILLMEDSDPENISSGVIENLGEVNMGDPDVLVDFVNWSVENFPAQQYALFFSDHGGGWAGFGGDESTENGDSLTMPEFDQAFAEITANLGRKLDIIGFDACLMNQFEVSRMLAPYADYAILAEETEPGYGWSYDVIMQYLVENPGMSAVELGQIVVDSYMQFYTEVVTDYDVFDLSVLDLSRVNDLSAALNKFAVTVQANADEVLSAIGDARANAQTFGGSTNPDDGDFFSSVDLIHFMKLMVQLSPNSDVAAAAQGVIDAAGSVVVYSQANSGLPDAHGMAIYFPRNQRIFDDNQLYVDYESDVAYLTDWQAFLNVFYGKAIEAIPPAVAAETKAVTIQGVFPSNTVSIHQPPVVMFRLDAQDIVEVSFSATLVLDDGTQIMLDESPLVLSVLTDEGEQILSYPDGPNDNEFTWGAEMPVVTDGAVSIETLLISNRSDPNSVAVAGTYIPQSGSEVKANLVFDLETGQVTKVWGVTESSSPYEIRTVQPGDHFLPSWRFLDENNEHVLIPAAYDPLTFGADPFTFKYVPAESGTYLFTIRVEDIAGNLYSDSTTITVDNVGLDTAYRGFTDVEFGLNFLYPWDWLEPSVTEAGDQIVISNPEGDIVIIVMSYEAASNDEMLEAANEYINGFGFTDIQISEPEATTAGGYDAYQTSYTYTGEDGPHTGAVISVYVDGNQAGYLIDLDTIDEKFDQADEAYGMLSASVNFFMPPSFEMPTETSSGSVTALLAELGYTVEEVNATLSESDMSVELLQQMVDNGDITLAEIREILGGTPPESSGSTGQPAASTGSVTKLLTELGYTVEEVNAVLAEEDLSVEILQQMVDNGDITLDEIRAALSE